MKDKAFMPYPPICLKELFVALFYSSLTKKNLVFIIRKTKRKHVFKRSDKTRKTKCTLGKSPFFLRLRTK